MFRAAPIFLIICCHLATGCGVPTAISPVASTVPITPDDTLFTGATRGCGDFFVYRFDATGKLVLSVSLDEAKLDWSKSSVAIEIEANVAQARVEVLQFRDPPTSYFCDDVGGDPEPIAQWQAVAGELVIERTLEPPPPEYPNATHQISVTLRNIHLQNAKTSETAVIEELEIKDVQVGWYAG